MNPIVMMTEFVPAPPDSGGKLRSYAEVVRLAEIAPVTLVAFEDGVPDYRQLRDSGIEVVGVPRPTSTVTALRGLPRTGSGTAARFWSPAMVRAIRKLGPGPADVLVVGHAQMAPYGRLVPARHRILDLHNVESSLIDSYRASASGLRAAAAAIEVRALRRLERRAIGYFDTVLTVSERDRSRLPAGTAEIFVCPNGTELGPALPSDGEPVAVFVALMGWAPNAEAAEHLARSVWPLVRAKVPGAQLLLVGRDPTPAVQALAGPDIEVTGRVAEIAPYLARSTVALAPLLAGGGSRLKILEALAAARPVVATTVGAEGLEDLIGEGVVVADRAEELAGAIADLLADPDRAQALGANGRSAVVARYGWDATLAPLLERVRSSLP